MKKTLKCILLLLIFALITGCSAPAVDLEIFNKYYTTDSKVLNVASRNISVKKESVDFGDIDPVTTYCYGFDGKALYFINEKLVNSTKILRYDITTKEWHTLAETDENSSLRVEYIFEEYMVYIKRFVRNYEYHLFNLNTGTDVVYFTPSMNKDGWPYTSTPNPHVYLDGKIYYDDVYLDENENTVWEVLCYDINEKKSEMLIKNAEYPLLYKNEIIYYKDGWYQYYNANDGEKLFSINNEGQTQMGRVFSSNDYISYLYYLYDEGGERVYGTALGYYDGDFNTVDFITANQRALYLFDAKIVEGLLAFTPSDGAPVVLYDIERDEILVVSEEVKNSCAYSYENQICIVEWEYDENVKHHGYDYYIIERY